LIARVEKLFANFDDDVNDDDDDNDNDNDDDDDDDDENDDDADTTGNIWEEEALTVGFKGKESCSFSCICKAKARARLPSSSCFGVFGWGDMLLLLLVFLLCNSRARRASRTGAGECWIVAFFFCWLLFVTLVGGSKAETRGPSDGDEKGSPSLVDRTN